VSATDLWQGVNRERGVALLGEQGDRNVAVGTRIDWTGPDRTARAVEAFRAAGGQFWHGHIAALISEERPDLDAELLAHTLLATLHSDPILRLLEQGEGRRLADSLRTLAAALLNAPAGSAERRNGGYANAPQR
jgi:hypothetical protein